MRRLSNNLLFSLPTVALSFLFILFARSSYATVDICEINHITKQCIWADEMNFSYIGYGWQQFAKHGQNCVKMEAYCQKNNYQMTEHPYLLELIAIGVLLLVVSVMYYSKRHLKLKKNSPSFSKLEP